MGLSTLNETNNPFAPGESPFKVKGFSHKNSLAWLDGEVRGGLTALFAELRDPLRIFFQQTFLDGTWYDVLPAQPLFQAAARLTKQSPFDLARKASASQAQKMISGMHRTLLKFDSPEQVVERLPVIAKQYLNFVDTRVECVAPKCWRAIGEGIPAGVVQLYMATSEAFTGCSLEVSGANEPHQRWQPIKPMGQNHGVAVVQAIREITWK
jgi:hypothetical protein